MLIWALEKQVSNTVVVLFLLKKYIFAKLKVLRPFSRL